jgi:hypothetical protein
VEEMVELKAGIDGGVESRDRRLVSPFHDGGGDGGAKVPCSHSLQQKRATIIIEGFGNK